MNVPSRNIFLPGLLAALVGCASTPGPGSALRNPPPGGSSAELPGTPACFRAADFDGSWITLNDRELIVFDPVFSRSYLIRLAKPVYNLKRRNHLRFLPFTPADGCICNGLSDFVLADHSGLAGHVPIVAVRELTESQERQLLQRHHLEPPVGRPARAHRRPDNACPMPLSSASAGHPHAAHTAR